MLIILSKKGEKYMGKFAEMDLERTEREMRSVQLEASANFAKMDKNVKNARICVEKASYGHPDVDIDIVTNEICYANGLKTDNRIRMVAE